MSESTDLRSLFAAYVSGEVTAEQLQELEAALREDADLRREFIEYLNIDSALGDLAALPSTEVAEIEREETEESASGAVPDIRVGRRFRIALAVGTISATLLLAAFLWFPNPGDHSYDPVATLVTDVNAVLLRNGQVWSDTGLPTGRYELDRGLLHLRFDGGVTVYVEAPAQFEPVSGQLLLLHSGRLSASVPPEGVGFTVETPEAQIIDFGTEFSIDVASGASEVHVFKGLVRVQPRSSSGGKTGDAVDLRTSQAVKIEDVNIKPKKIKLAKDRFIRDFAEPKRRYPRSMKQLSPVAYYRMPIRDKGLVSDPPEYSGVVLTGDGNRPPHASGAIAGGSLRVLADSTGRGGRVDTPPSLLTGQFTLAAFVYLEARIHDGMVATNIGDDHGNFALALDEDGLLQATIRKSDGDLQSVSSEVLLPLQTWCHLVMSVDGEQLRVHVDGQPVASSPSSLLADSKAEALWFGTNPDGLKLWNGRIDEVALLDKALSDAEITNLYRAALEEMGRSE